MFKKNYFLNLAIKIGYLIISACIMHTCNYNGSVLPADSSYVIVSDQ